MKKETLVVGLLLTSVLLSNCKTEPPNANSGLGEAKAAIAKSNEIYFQAFVKNDSSIFIDRLS